MIKAEVIFDGDWMQCNGFEIVCIGERYHVNNGGGYFETLEDAIQFCMEQSQ